MISGRLLKFPIYLSYFSYLSFPAGGKNGNNKAWDLLVTKGQL